jgi:hypothetical protein
VIKQSRYSRNNGYDSLQYEFRINELGAVGNFLKNASRLFRHFHDIAAHFYDIDTYLLVSYPILSYPTLFHHDLQYSLFTLLLVS